MSSFKSFLILITTSLYGGIGQKYIYVDVGRNILKAEKWCQDEYGTHLASIHSQADQDEASALCETDRNCWIGLSDEIKEGKWIWSDGSPLNIELWGDNEPNNDTGNEDCVILDNFTRTNNRGKWFAKDCNLAQRILCNAPTNSPTLSPTNVPSLTPTFNPTIHPTVPTRNPTIYPSINPSNHPTFNPTNIPTNIPSVDPTALPSAGPSLNPSLNPSFNPSKDPSMNPSHYPTPFPSMSPTIVNQMEGNVNLRSTTQSNEDENISNDTSVDSVTSASILLGMILMSIALCILIFVIIFLYIAFKRRTAEIEKQVAMQRNLEIEIRTKDTEHKQDNGQHSNDNSALPVPMQMSNAFTISNLSIHNENIHHVSSATSLSDITNQITPTPDNYAMNSNSNSNQEEEDDSEEETEELYSDPGSMLNRQVTAGSVVSSFVEPIQMVNSASDLCILSEMETQIGPNFQQNYNNEPAMVTPEGMEKDDEIEGDDETK